jgi:hypothetical protein
MANIVRCECGQRVKVNDSRAGKRVRCPACGEAIDIPVTSASASRAGVHPARTGRRAARRPDMITILQLGLGRYFSIWGAIGILVCVMSLFHSIERFRYALKSTPTVIDVSANGVSHNDYVQLTAELNFDNGLQIEKIGGKAYTLMPVVGSNNRLIVYEKGHATHVGNIARERTFKGRIVAQGFGDDWALDEERIEVVQEFAREGIDIPEDVLVLDTSDHPSIQLVTVKQSDLAKNQV